MHINGARVALGAVAGAGVIAAAAAGLDSLVDSSSVQAGTDKLAGIIINQPDLASMHVAHLSYPTWSEHVAKFVGDNADKAVEVLQQIPLFEQGVSIDTLHGTASITKTGMESLMNDPSLSQDAKDWLQNAYDAAIKHAAGGSSVPAGVTLPTSPAVEASSRLQELESLIQPDNKPIGNGIAVIDPASMPGMVQMPLSNGQSLFVNPDNFVAHYDALTQGLKGKELEAMEALKAHLTPALDLETIGIGAGVGALAGAASSAVEKKFTDRIQPRAAQPVQPKRAEGQPWVQVAQADQQQQADGPRVVR